ncbi:regulatory signaling modulator protein AmpE [Aquipseudomonas ullengensis]|uniref:Regulatory signaling modulator protein AmpE n=1 Tax=Aquipseudomonas ullengensis TaxID=2759166 RepID=A0A7W4LLN4_9GAMM|nr:regulatory signaling modulator protein AmpE [Pseudomonas ullengensis]MBB2495439.1 regulatory signaling modulator protein AmpE [Pseudomonas ullengensis]
MNFLVLLLVVWVEKLSSGRQRIQQDGFWRQWLARVEGRPGAEPWISLALLVLVPMALLGLLLLIIQPLAYGWLALPVHLLVLVYSLGRGDVLTALGPFRDAWRRGDEQAALHVAERDMGLEADAEAELLLRVQGYELWQAYQGFFAVIFWYALLGPALALAYRLLALTAEHATQPVLAERAAQLRHALDWLPVRFLAASFALVGNFAAVSRAVLHDLLAWDIPAADLLSNAGRAAGELPEPQAGEAGVNSLDELWQLLVRSAVLWYAAFAVWILLF